MIFAALPFLALLGQQPSTTLEPSEKKAAIQALSKSIEERYVEVELSKKIAGSLRTWSNSEEFEKLTAGPEFAAKVNEILKANVTDAHFRFRYTSSVLPVRTAPTEPSEAELKRAARETRFMNANFEKVERMRGNVGYVKFNGFASPEDMKQPVEGAMRFLGNCDAFIVDLRNNGGGHPSGVQLFCSYFFAPEPVHLNNIFFRRGDQLQKTEFWTLKEVAGPRFPNAPLYVLTSKRTGSGAEECAYNFQQLKRGTIIGEPSWGGANPGGVVRLSDHFQCFIPVGKAQNPHSGTNWEGKGVIPDVAVPPADGLKTGHVMALKALIEKADDPDVKADLSAILKEVEAGG